MNTPTQAQAQAQVHAAAPTAQTTVGLASFNRSRSTIRAFFKAWPPLVLVSLAWLATMLTAALLADWLMPYGFTQIDLRARLQPPVLFGGAWNHVLGTDELGRDVLSRTLSAIQVSLLIAFSSTVLSTVLGVTLVSFLFAAANVPMLLKHGLRLEKGETVDDAAVEAIAKRVAQAAR